MHQLGAERMNQSFHLHNTPEVRSGMHRIVDCPVCGMKTLDFYWICEHCGWEYNGTTEDEEESDANGMTLTEYAKYCYALAELHERHPEENQPNLWKFLSQGNAPCSAPHLLYEYAARGH